MASDAFHRMESIRWFNILEARIDEEVAKMRDEPDTTDEARENWERISVTLRNVMKRGAAVAYESVRDMARERGFEELPEWHPQFEPDDQD